MPEEKKLTEVTEQPQEQEKPAGVPPVSTSRPTSSETDTSSPRHENVETDGVEREIECAGTAPVPDNPDEKAPTVSEVDTLREENFNLKAQLEAMRTGFLPDIIEDAVVLAENIVKRSGGDISEALKAVAKKYPEWTAAAQSEKKSGFKVGADSSGGTSTDEEKLNTIFGIKKKTGGKN